MADGAGSSLNCGGIGICNSKLFQKPRRVYRPGPEIRTDLQNEPRPPPVVHGRFVIPSKQLPPAESIASIEPIIYRQKVKVKRSHRRRDRKRKASNSVEQPEESVLPTFRRKKEEEEEEGEEEEDEKSTPPIAQILLRICGLLFVIFGLGVLIYAIMLVISSMTDGSASDKLNKILANKFDRPIKTTFREWEEKNNAKLGRS